MGGHGSQVQEPDVKPPTQNSEESALAELNQRAVNLNGLDVDAIGSLDKACFIVCNTYTTPTLRLGVGPLNDSILVAQNHTRRGYQVFFLHNPRLDQFLAFLPVFLRNTVKALTVFYTGHGINVPDLNGDESDGLDEAMVFDGGKIVIDDRLLEILIKNANGRTRILLLSDCCHSGSIWDIQSGLRQRGIAGLPANIISIAGSSDSQQAKQTQVGKDKRGMFTYHFWKAVNARPYPTPHAIEQEVNAAIAQYEQKMVAAATRPKMLTEPIF
jgi:hypothetical protein